MATHSSILAWRIPQTEKPHRLQSMGHQRVGHNSVTKITTINKSYGEDIIVTIVILLMRKLRHR